MKRVVATKMKEGSSEERREGCDRKVDSIKLLSGEQRALAAAFLSCKKVKDRGPKKRSRSKISSVV